MYESVRQTLRRRQYLERSSKPLVFWALPKDRRLPLALMGHSLKDLLAHSFEELGATAGVGKKKLYSLVMLLHRATKDLPAETSAVSEESLANKRRTRAARPKPSGFDSAAVSELLWEQWRTTVRRCGLEQETLGRLCPSLYRLPTVIWRTPLDEYLDITIGEMRRRKTHGEKRVQAILEVFYNIHEALGQVSQQGHLQVLLRPRFIMPIERWINEVQKSKRAPGRSDLKKQVVAPVLEQLRIDLGPQVVRLVEERLGVNAARQSVQQQARRLRVTRARIYQLLETCAEVMSLRWPEGRGLMESLNRKLPTFPKAQTQIAQLRALTELIYPSLEQARVAAP
jgi:hypothetical protein